LQFTQLIAASQPNGSFALGSAAAFSYNLAAAPRAEWRQTGGSR
jgi:hypothetical protein